MKILFKLFYILIPIFRIAQDSNQLLQIHNVSDIASMNNTSSPNEGNLVYVQSNDQIHYYDGSLWQAISSSGSSSGWSLSGNSVNSTDFLGSTNNIDFNLVTNGASRIIIKNTGRIALGTYIPTGIFEVKPVPGQDGFVVANNGNVGIDTDNPTQKLHVVGNILASGSITPDYVFEHYFEGESKLKTDYKLNSLEQTIEFAKKHKHLPSIPSAIEVEQKGGIILNKSVEQNLEKIEELHIYIYELSNELDYLLKLANE